MGSLPSVPIYWRSWLSKKATDCVGSDRGAFDVPETSSVERQMRNGSRYTKRRADWEKEGWMSKGAGWGWALDRFIVHTSEDLSGCVLVREGSGDQGSAENFSLGSVITSHNQSQAISP